MGENHVEMKAETTKQGTPKIASKPPEARDKHGTDSPSQPSEGTNPADTLILDFQPPELCQMSIYLYPSLSTLCTKGVCVYKSFI